MSNLSYPARFVPEEEGGYSIFFPDLPGCYTCGDDLEDGLLMAADALDLYITCSIEDGDPLPPPSAPEDISLSDGEFVKMISYH